MRRRCQPTFASIVAVAALALAAAGCGGGSPGVASVASSTVRSAAGSSATSRTNALLLAGRCLREHGLANMPDPTIATTGPAKGQAILPKAFFRSVPSSVVNRAVPPWNRPESIVVQPRELPKRFRTGSPSLAACADTASRTSPTRTGRANSISPEPGSTATSSPRSSLPRREPACRSRTAPSIFRNRARGQPAAADDSEARGLRRPAPSRSAACSGAEKMVPTWCSIGDVIVPHNSRR